MHQFGYTRSARESDHFLFTPETFVRAPLPGMHKATAIVHVSPAAGAAFTQYTVEFENGGSLGPAVAQRFLYLLEGALILRHAETEHRLQPEMYAYLPAGDETRIAASQAGRAVVIEKAYQALPELKAPAFFIGEERTITPQPLQGDETLLVRSLVPADPAFDFAVNTMTYQPGASLPMVESHVMEHGLLMLAGGGVYRLGDKWYPVTAGDFIWMAPYCPQWFGALGKIPAKYLIYKDWNRHPLTNR